jgi:hypothetical protein
MLNTGSLACPAKPRKFMQYPTVATHIHAVVNGQACPYNSEFNYLMKYHKIDAGM